MKSYLTISIALLTLSSCFFGVWDGYITEGEARKAAAKCFLHELGVEMLPDYFIENSTLSIPVDLYDPGTKIGFIYISKDDVNVPVGPDADEITALYDDNSAFILVVPLTMIGGAATPMSTSTSIRADITEMFHDIIEYYLSILRKEGRLS